MAKLRASWPPVGKSVHDDLARSGRLQRAARERIADDLPALIHVEVSAEEPDPCSPAA